jgi:hypothetical protein
MRAAAEALRQPAALSIVTFLRCCRSAQIDRREPAGVTEPGHPEDRTMTTATAATTLQPWMKNPAAVLHRRRARRTGPDRSRHPARRPGRSRPGEVWDEAARCYDEKGLAALVLTIATTNLFNRLNVTTRQLAGGTWG